MMQVIGQEYIDGILALEDGNERIYRWVSQLISERDDAQMIAAAVIEKYRTEKSSG